MKETIQIIKEEVNSRRLYQSVKEVSSYHRIQASSGYRKAAQHCVSYLKEQGIEARLLQYPANATDYAGTYKLFQEWECTEAVCDMVYPYKKRLADFSLEPISVLQKSYPCDYRNTPLDVILMDRGDDPNSYENIDFKGKIVFIHEHFRTYQWVLKKGAVGFISDFLNEVPNVRTRADMYDSLNYTSFWWKHSADEIPAFGFVLSPRDGDEFTRLCLELRKESSEDPNKKQYPQVCPYVNARLFDGKIDVVEAVLPGKEEETILMTAHLCHPCASANDNASGVAGAMEVMRSLHQLQKEKKLAPIKKTIKMILVPEFTGTYCYLCDGRDISNITAGINLDMIGGKQQGMYGPVTITNLPHAMPSFVDSFANMTAQNISEDTSSKEAMQMSLVHVTDVPFQLGSDHFILSDPMVHIPCIMLGQWPDKNYHTSTDTLEVIDPVVLKYSTVLAASYVYGLAEKTVIELEPLLNQMRLQFVKEMNRIASTATEYKALSIRKSHEFFQASLASVLAYFPQDGELIKQEASYYDQLYAMYEKEEKQESYSISKEIPVRQFTTPIADVKDLILNHEELCHAYESYRKQHPDMAKKYDLLQVLCDYYTDGKRSVDEIADCVTAEAGYGNKADIAAYIEFMKLANLMIINN